MSIYNNWAAQQNWNAFEVFHNFLEKVKPKRIIEIGTSLGGFTSFLNYTCKKLNLDCHILSYDIITHHWYDEMRKNGIDLRIENIFYNNYTTTKKEVIDFIQKDGLTLILCDGGDKIKEFNLLSKYMKKGDFIMTHDYVETKEKFDNEIYLKIWNWHEVSESDLQKACEENGLISYDKEIFDNVVWVCKIKK